MREIISEPGTQLLDTVVRARSLAAGRSVRQGMQEARIQHVVPAFQQLKKQTVLQ
jgi:hypothetical protein